ncbi:MAG: hypothetical protein L0Y58_25670 [Verrucomicrobia subdivision 3 bacterium]|nr:hypothetical protein [Limisphaerales bacterium]
MLRLLTDEHISPAVARHAAKQCRGIHITAIQSWEGGHFLNASDALLLEEAHKQKLTLATFDLRTIPALLRAWAVEGIDHSGVVLIDERTISQNDIGGLVTALCALWKEQRHLNWANRVVYLRAPD